MNINRGITVIMPTYNQEAFIRRAILGLIRQSFDDWELIIINDGSTDQTNYVIEEFLRDPRIRYYCNSQNIGLGASLNRGLDLATNDLITYLPSDDCYYKDHLSSLQNLINNSSDTVLTYSGVECYTQQSLLKNEKVTTFSQIAGFSLQLVQVMHLYCNERWIERSELVTDNLYQMYWYKLMSQGIIRPTGIISCNWGAHPMQRHKIINQKFGGGISMYRSYYKIDKPIKFQLPTGVILDENICYSSLKKENITNNTGLKILIVGELAYNPDRIIALEENGHKLYGLWLDKPKFSNFVGPLPFGNVIDIAVDNWIEAIKSIKPDIIYALLNSETVPFAHKVLLENPGIPFVWHFKEGPTFSQIGGFWNQLMDLYKFSDGQIFINGELKGWFENYVPLELERVLILDGDLPKKDWFTDERSNLLSDLDGEIHTVLPGRPMGISPQDIQSLAQQQIHVHFYGLYQDTWKDWIIEAREMAPGYIHVHENCLPKDWVKEFSKYDAGWLHNFKSENNGELIRSTWDDLNLPARISTLAAAGLPMLQFKNPSKTVASQNLLEEFDIGIFYDSIDNIKGLFNNKARIIELRNNVWSHRMKFTFDYHVQNLIKYFKKIINIAEKKGTRLNTHSRIPLQHL